MATTEAALDAAFGARGATRPDAWAEHESTAAYCLVAEYGAEAVAGCCLAIEQGRFGDSYDRAHLSYGYLRARGYIERWQERCQRQEQRQEHCGGVRHRTGNHLPCCPSYKARSLAS